MKNRFALIVGAVILGLSAMLGAQVSEDVPQPQLQEQPQEQPPMPGQPQAQGQSQAQAGPLSSVARVSLIHGDVSTQRGDSGDWAAAALNQPILNSDKVSTGVDSRAEVELNSRNILRLGDHTLAGIASLSQNQIQIQLERGMIDYTIFKGSEAQAEIDTANVAVRPAQNGGIYRIEVNAEGETQVIVRRGTAQISTPQGSTQVEAGQMAIVRGTGDDTQYKLAEAPAKDAWDSWNVERDRIIYNAHSWADTNRNYTGAEDLDSYGRWVTVPNYGPVWSPVVGPGWAPYRSGRWVWEPGWGWTWVSYEPWGWAPYHYGRWFVYDNSWVWWPGPAYGYPGYRPVWAPAYVSFFGFGGGVGVGVGFGFGSVGWLPVGPCDRFYPWYGRYGSHYNVVSITNINNFHNGPGRGYGGIAPLRPGGEYSNLRLASMNERVRGGISTVPTDRFGTGRSAPLAVNSQTFRSGRMIAGNLPVVPTRAALSVTDRPAAASTIPRGGVSQHFYSKARPAAAPQPFNRQVAQMRQSIQRNGSGAGQFSRGETQSRSQMQAQSPARGTLSTPNNSGARSATSESSGWQRFSNSAAAQRDNAAGRSAGSPAASSMNVARPGNSARPEASSNDGGWRHFTPQSGGGYADRANGGGGSYIGRGSGPEFQRGSGPEFQRGPEQGMGGGRNLASEAPRSYSRPPLEMRQPIVMPRASEGRSMGARESAPRGGGGNHGGGGGSHGGSSRR